jgi:hypothetical protein
VPSFIRGFPCDPPIGKSRPSRLLGAGPRADDRTCPWRIRKSSHKWNGPSSLVRYPYRATVPIDDAPVNTRRPPVGHHRQTPGGVRAVVAESLLLKHQLLISGRARRRAPNLNSSDRLLLGIGSLFVPPSRTPKLAVILKPRTLFRFHEALKRCKYRWLFSSGGHRRPGPKGPSKELIDAIVEFKRRNPRAGCPRIAQEITHAFGIEINKDIVRRSSAGCSRNTIDLRQELMARPGRAL